MLFLLVIVELLLDAVEVEGISNKFVVDLAEEEVIFEIAEPLNPSSVFLRAVVGLAGHDSKL